MKISHDIREEAERVAGLEAQKSAFTQGGGPLYMPVHKEFAVIPDIAMRLA